MANHFVVQLLSWVHSLWLHGLQHVGVSCLSLSQSLLRLISTESMMSSKQLVLCCPLLLLPKIFPNIRVFSSESPLHIWWPMYWSFSFSISPFQNIMGDFLMIDWCDLLADSQESSPAPQYEIIMSLVLSLFYGLSHWYMTSRKNIALTICTLQTFVDKTVPMFRFVIALIPRTSIFKVHGCSHCPQWFWSPGK